MARVVTFGEAMLRLSAPLGERLALTRGLDVHVGGAESNVAVALARLRVQAVWLSRLPENPLGQRVVSELAAAGVDVSRIAWAEEGKLGLYFVEFGQPPRPTMVWYDRRDSAINVMEPRELAVDVLDGAAFAVLSGITPALSPAARALSLIFVDEARSRGANVCLDINYRSRLWTPDEARETLAELLRQADVVVCSEQDARLVFGLDGSDVDVIDAFKQRFAPDADLVALTQSEQGCLALERGGEVIKQPPFPTSVVDRFGAGDAFTAGLLWGLLQHDVPTALRAGAALAALKCTTVGDHSLSTLKELQDLMRNDTPMTKARLVR